MVTRNAVAIIVAAAALFACRAPDAIPAKVGRVVTLHYTVKHGDTFIDSTETKGAVTVLLGEKDGLLVGLRKGVVGMKAGEERAFSIPPEDGFLEGAWSGRLLQARVKVVSVQTEKK